MLSGLILTAALVTPAAGTGARVSTLPPVQIPSMPAVPTARAPGTQVPPAQAVQTPPPVQTPPSTPGNLPALPTTDTPTMEGSAASAMPTAQASGPQKPDLRDIHLGPPYSMWASTDYRILWMQSGPNPIPLLVAPGANGAPQVRIGGRDIKYGPANAGGFEVGTWLNDRHTVGVSIGGFLTEQLASFAAANSDPLGNPAMFRPFINVVDSLPAQLAVATPGVLAGGMWTESDSRLAGADLTFHRNIMYGADRSLTLLIGGRYLNLSESLSINQVSRPLGGAGVAPSSGPQISPGDLSVAISDRFSTRNQFYGGSLGLRGERFFGPVFVNLTAKVGMGTNHQDVEIGGASRVVSTAGTRTALGGLLALPAPAGGIPANYGKFNTSRFAVLSELGAQVGVQVSESLRILAGYDFLYLNDVARPGDQIDPFINPRLIPTHPAFGTLSGITSPVVTGARNEFFVHGVRLGFEVRY